MIQAITPKQLHNLQQSGQPIDILDVRSAFEYNTGHVPGARRLPLRQVNRQSATANRPGLDDHPVYIICHSGGRSMSACRKLIAEGFTNVVNVEGGTAAWKRAGLPIERPAGTGLRPVRIALLLLVGLLLALGLWVHPYFAYAAIVLWIGMLFAFGTCPLGACAGSLPRQHP